MEKITLYEKRAKKWVKELIQKEENVFYIVEKVSSQYGIRTLIINKKETIMGVDNGIFQDKIISVMVELLKFLIPDIKYLKYEKTDKKLIEILEKNGWLLREGKNYNFNTFEYQIRKPSKKYNDFFNNKNQGG